jgi:DNA invertase Pin-like site-specific DNA recombinase
VKSAGQSDTPVTAGIYCRISLAIEGDTTKTDDQERICRDLAGQLGWTVAEGVGHPDKEGVYTDSNKSAWQRNRNRPAWNQMLRDVEAGRINGIVVYHGDRLVRRGTDLAKLLDLAENKGVKLASPGGTYNLDRDRMMLWIRAAFAEEESQRTSERRQAQYDRWRRQGRVRPGGRGGRSYGFATDGITQLPEECEHVRDMAAMLLAGEPTGALVRDAAERGALTPAGKPFTHATVRKMLSRARYAGLMPDGESTAAWEPVLERRDWERVCEILEAKTATFAYATNARKWLLSGIAVCGAPFGDGECGAPMQLRPSKGRGRQEYANGYGCSRAECRKSYRSAPHLDAYVSAAVIARLNNPLNPQAEAPEAPDSAKEWAALTKERAKTEAAAKDYRTSPGRLDILMARLDSIDARMEQLRGLETSGSRSRLLERYQGITREEWEALDLSVRRALVAACVRVTVLPASGRGPGFRTQDVRVEPLG